MTSNKTPLYLTETAVKALEAWRDGEVTPSSVRLLVTYDLCHVEADVDLTGGVTPRPGQVVFQVNRATDAKAVYELLHDPEFCASVAVYMLCREAGLGMTANTALFKAERMLYSLPVAA